MKINTNNEKKLQKAINKSQSRAHVRMISPDDVTDAVERIERKLAGMLFKKDWKGLMFRIDPHASHFYAYRYPPESTQFLLERGANGWFMVGCYRDRVQSTYKITPTTRDWMVEPFEKKKDALADFAHRAGNWS